MAQVILVENDDNLSELITLNLSNYIGAQLIPRGSARDANDLLEILPQTDLVITKDNIGPEKTADLIAQYIESKGLKTKLLVLGNKIHSENDFISIINDEKDWELALRKASEILGFNIEIVSRPKGPEYIPIKARHLLFMDICCCDVYIRIKKGPEHYQFIKRIRSEERYDRQMVSRYIEQGLEHFYILKEMKEWFTNYLSDQLVRRLEVKEEDERLEILADGFSMALEEVLEMGLNPGTIQMADSIVTGIISNFDQTSEVGKLLQKIVNSKTNYIYQHSHLTSLIAMECAKNLKVDYDASKELFTYAAFFKDIFLAEKEALAKLNNFEEVEKQELSEEEWDLVMNHANLAADMVSHHPAPSSRNEIVLMIKHHHGSINGKGFFASSGTKLPTLSQIFMVSCDFVTELLRYKEEGGQPRPILKALYTKYSNPEILPILKSLEFSLKQHKNR